MAVLAAWLLVVIAEASKLGWAYGLAAGVAIGGALTVVGLLRGVGAAPLVAVVLLDVAGSIATAVLLLLISAYLITSGFHMHRHLWENLAVALGIAIVAAAAFGASRTLRRSGR